jgi:hypothetical protein
VAGGRQVVDAQFDVGLKAADFIPIKYNSSTDFASELLRYSGRRGAYN